MRKSDIIVLEKNRVCALYIVILKKQFDCACDFLFGASYHKFIKKSFSY